ncbi:cupin domain-containing protein [Neokomagataea anthophila]|uniref:Cupin domain-containing protein n=1 Tax=Neokomagataea anthophila TaxID=2826925 RepID=A0ABS5E7A6_9PROT|nr:cupin domain-containing protein [Neokomagataea anthophila]MBR0559795.1 cupin domain-containing protein [Neokomagataea anthophila]
MNLLIPISKDPDILPRDSIAELSRLISGNPTFKTWPLDTSRNGNVRTGVWQATPGTTQSIKGEAFEFCHILEGLVKITENDGTSYIFKAGDNFIMKPGFEGIWETIETVKKIYVFVE